MEFGVSSLQKHTSSPTSINYVDFMLLLAVVGFIEPQNIDQELSRLQSVYKGSKEVCDRVTDGTKKPKQRSSWNYRTRRSSEVVDEDDDEIAPIIQHQQNQRSSKQLLRPHRWTVPSRTFSCLDSTAFTSAATTPATDIYLVKLPIHR